MDTESRGLQQGSSACWSTGAAAWGSSQQKRQRCEGSSSDQVGSSTSGSVQMSEPELPGTDYVENEEEDYYMDDDDDDCDDENDDESEYEFDEADFNQQLADKFDDLDLPPGVEATVPWLQKIAAQDEEDASEITEDEITRKYKAFPQFYTVENFSDHHYADKSVGKPSREWAKRIQHEWKLLEKDLPAWPARGGVGCRRNRVTQPHGLRHLWSTSSRRDHTPSGGCDFSSPVLYVATGSGGAIQNLLGPMNQAVTALREVVDNIIKGELGINLPYWSKAPILVMIWFYTCFSG